MVPVLADISESNDISDDEDREEVTEVISEGELEINLKKRKPGIKTMFREDRRTSK